MIEVELLSSVVMKREVRINMRAICKSLESEGKEVRESHGHRGLHRIGANKVVARGAKNGDLKEMRFG